MNSTHPYIIVAALDSSEMAPLVLEHAFAQACGHSAAEVHVLGVVDTGHRFLRRERPPSDELAKTELRLRLLIEEEISNFDGGLTSDGELAIRVHARAGVPDEQIVELAAEARAHLIVMGRHGDRGRRRFLVGSVPERVTRAARCPVMIAQVPDYDSEEATEPQCAACVAVRRETNGEKWFCAEHTTELPWRSSYLRVTGGAPIRDQGLWF